MRKLLANKVFLLILTTLLIISIFIFDMIPGNPVHDVFSPVTLILDPVEHLVRGAGNKISSFFSAISDGVELREENEKLKDQVSELQYQVQQDEEAARRWEELKDALHIKDSFENYDIFGASILTREADEWFSVIRLEVGSSDGITQIDDSTYAVVDAQMNLAGRIMYMDKTSSKVLPILHEGFTVSAKVNAVNGAVVTVHGDIELKEQGLCMVDQIPNGVQLVVGDELVTSGEGGVYPAGIPIGVITSIDDSSSLTQTATLEPYVDISTLKDLFVMVPNELSTADDSAEDTTQAE